MISLASMMSVSNLSTIGFLEDEEDDYYWSVRSSIMLIHQYMYMYVPHFASPLIFTLPLSSYLN